MLIVSVLTLLSVLSALNEPSECTPHVVGVTTLPNSIAHVVKLENDGYPHELAAKKDGFSTESIVGTEPSFHAPVDRVLGHVIVDTLQRF